MDAADRLENWLLAAWLIKESRIDYASSQGVFGMISGLFQSPSTLLASRAWRLKSQQQEHKVALRYIELTIGTIIALEADDDAR